MSIQQVRGENTPDQKLTISWTIMKEVKGISIEVARDANFSLLHRHFVIPISLLLPKEQKEEEKVKEADSLPPEESKPKPKASFEAIPCQVGLDVGNGQWFFRVGAWNGTDLRGSIDWSGMYGPIYVLSLKQAIAIKPSTFSLLHTQSLAGGIRLHTDLRKEVMYIGEYSTEDKFLPSSKKTFYVRDNLVNSYFDVINLQPSFTYAIRCVPLSSNETEMLTEWKGIKGMKTLTNLRPFNSGDVAVSAAEKTLLREAHERPMRFTSQSEYAAFLAAKAKSTSKLNKI